MKKFTVLASIISVTIITITALFLGRDGAILIASFTIIGGLGGYEIGKKKSPK